MNHLLARKKSFRGKQSEAGSTTPSSAPSDKRPKEAKSTPYARPSYETMLATKKSFMDKSDEGIQKASSDLCQTLLSSAQAYPPDSLFRDNLFNTTCKKVRNRNEAMVVRDILPLIIPSAQTLATYSATHLNHLIESVNEGWNSSRPFYSPRPQPDYSLGFGRSAGLRARTPNFSQRSCWWKTWRSQKIDFLEFDGCHNEVKGKVDGWVETWWLSIEQWNVGV